MENHGFPTLTFEWGKCWEHIGQWVQWKITVELHRSGFIRSQEGPLRSSHLWDENVWKHQSIGRTAVPENLKIWYRPTVIFNLHILWSQIAPNICFYLRPPWFLGVLRWVEGIHQDCHYHVEQNRSLRSEVSNFPWSCPHSLTGRCDLFTDRLLLAMKVSWQAVTSSKAGKNKATLCNFNVAFLYFFCIAQNMTNRFSFYKFSTPISSLHVWWKSTGKLSSAVPESNNKKFMNWSWQNVEGDKSHGASFVRRGRRETDWE